MSDNITKWLEELGLGRFASVFAEQQIDHEVLPELTDEDLEKLGIPLGPRKKLLKAIGELQRGLATPLPESVLHTATLDTSHAERRQLTVMFCDLVGSTELSSAHFENTFGLMFERIPPDANRSTGNPLPYFSK
jgi:hypothetical protein